MTIITKFPEHLQIGEQDGRFYIVGISRYDQSIDILLELTTETLWGAMRNLDNTEAMDFKVYDLRYGIGHTCDEFDWNGCKACSEEYCGDCGLERELLAAEEANEKSEY
jgi:hypothetical protein